MNFTSIFSFSDGKVTITTDFSLSSSSTLKNMDSMNVFDLDNNIVLDNDIDTSVLLMANYNIYDVRNNYHNNNVNIINVNNNFTDTFIYDDHNYYDDDFNGDDIDNGNDGDGDNPEVDDTNTSSNNSNTKNNNIKNGNHIKNSKLSKKRRTPNHLHVKFHEVDDSNDNHDNNNNINVNISSSFSSNNDSVANIGNNNDNNFDNIEVVTIDHNANNINSTSYTTSTTDTSTTAATTATTTATTTNATSNTTTTTISTTATNGDDTSYMMTTATTISTTTSPTSADDTTSYMYNGRLWTEEMDKELSTLHSIYNLEKDWAQKITNIINIKFHTTLSSSQISKRWTQYLRPELSKRKVGLWSETEIKQLHELVYINSYESKNIKGMIVVHWENVALALNRRYYDCQNKWNTIKKSTLKGM